MESDPHYYAWLGWVISWLIFPAGALQSYLRFRGKKRRSDAWISIVCLVLFAIKIWRSASF